MEGDRNLMWCTQMENIFQSTPSAWRETTVSLEPYRRTAYFNPLPPHGGRRISIRSECKFFSISIHSLRMEGDRNIEQQERESKLFQSTPSAWRETQSAAMRSRVSPFQSTPSAWRETLLTLSRDDAFLFQSTPSAWRETICICQPDAGCLHFNPLPPHGGRRVYKPLPDLARHFNPLPPHGGRRQGIRHFRKRRSISIHSLRMEGDMRRINDNGY